MINFYRYDAVEYATIDLDGEFVSSKFPNPKIELQTFNLVKETPKGYWICWGDPNSLHSKKIWVSKTARKRYAYPTKKEALNSFIKRKESQLKILKYQVEYCQISVSIAKEMFEKEYASV